MISSILARLLTPYCIARLHWVTSAVLLTLSCASELATAASIPERISFQNIIENKDITMGEGASFLQDSQGFMWLGGGTALIRYDGYDFRQMFITDENKPNEKEPVYFTESIFEDSHHTIWVASRRGLLKFDPTKEKLTRVSNDESQPLDIATINIERIVELPSGELLVCSVAGLFFLNPETLKYTAIVADRSKANWLTNPRANAMLLDGPDTVWLASEEGLEKLNWKTKTFTLYKVNPEQPDSVPDNKVRDIVADGEGKFWLATANGVVHYDPKTHTSKRYVNSLSDRFSLGGNDVWYLLMDSQGVLWATSDGGGASVYDKSKDRFINHQYEPGRPGSLNTSKARGVYEDRNGDIWVGCYPTGINFFDRSSAPIVTYTNDTTNPNSLSYNRVLTIQEDKLGNLWLGTDGAGLNYFDREKGNFTHFRNSPTDPATINGDSVLASMIDSTGLIWTGVWGGGVATYNPADKKFTRYPFDTERKITERLSTSTRLNSAPVWSIREDKNHEIWITTHYGGVSKYNQESKIFTHYTHVEGDPESLTGNLAWTTLEDSKGDIWVGTASGLNRMNREKNTFTTFLPNPNDPNALSNSSALSIFEDSKKRLWIGTDAGLNLFNPETKNFTVFTKKDGFIDDCIRTILEDSEGNLWVSTNNGFASFNPDTKKIKTYNRISGRLVGGFATNSGMVTRRGEIIFGGTDGLRIFNPKELSENKTPPPVVFTDFKIFSDSVVVGGADGILKNAINQTDIVTLDYTKSMFVFSFSALNFRDSGKNKYSYKLEGFDNNWLDAGNQRTAKYTNLDAGKYVFKVKGSNNDGVWNDEGKTVTIIQLPPPWKTWWAYTIYVLIVLGLLSWFAYSQRRKRKLIEEQNKLLEIKVTERTAEVREKSKDIEAMLSNIPQGLFTVHDEGKIHPEYSRFLESIFNTDNIAGRNVNEFLFNGANIGADALDSARASISAIVGEDEMNFFFNQSLLINEYDINVGDQKKYLSLDWNPIIVDEVVSKLMVSVRDVTQLKQMESDAQQQKRQMDIVSQLLNISAEKYLGFEESAQRYLQVVRETIETTPQRDDKAIALLFRNMHTIKGNSRTFAFTYLSNIAHEVESHYSLLKATPDMPWEPAQLLGDVEKMEQGLAEYGHIYRAVLGRGGDANSDRRNGFWMHNSTMDKILTYVATRELEKLKTFLSRLNSITLEKNLADVIAALPSIAMQLDKKAPMVAIAPNNVHIKVKAQELVVDVFSHILRNSVDHGLESTQERIDAGKNEQGTITIQACVEQNALHISVRDDGRGLNIEGLRNKGLKLDKFKEADSPSIDEIAQLIFLSGVSTKEAITDISGRGVGLDAVKQFVTERKGNVAIKLYPEQAVNPGFIPFALVVTLPETLFFEKDELEIHSTIS